MKDTPTIKSLMQLLADSYALYLKTQNYHWNVTGPNFHSLHSLFEEQYTDLAAAIDTIAERIRSLGAKTPGTLSIFAKLTSIQDGNHNANAQEMVKQLADDQALILKTLKKALEAAQADNDEATIDLIIGRIDIHDKAAWMLSSSL